LEDIKEEILSLDINTVTPMEALMKLNEIKRMLTRKKFICFKVRVIKG
jgi:DNA mismatch repair protein MutS